MKCGATGDCGGDFTFGNVDYHGVCEGLRGTACDGDDKCDTVANFFCAEWAKGDGTKTPKCARQADCGEKYDSETVSCVGVHGANCTSDAGGDGGLAGCDPALGLRCGEEFSTLTYQFSGTPVCIAKGECGTAVEGGANGTVHLCYGDVPKGTECDGTTSCDLPADADAKAIACGHIAVKTDNKTDSAIVNGTVSICIDSDKYCKEPADNANLTVDYFGTQMSLECASVRNVLAMGAALISTYYAM